MAGHADEPGLALLARPVCGLQRAAGRHRLLVVGGGAEVVELPDVHVVRAQLAQALVELLQRTSGVAAAGLGGEHHLVAAPGQHLTHFFLAVAVGARGVEIVDAGVEGRAHDRHRVVHLERDYRDAAAAEAHHLQPGAAKSSNTQDDSPLRVSNRSKLRQWMLTLLSPIKG